MKKSFLALVCLVTLLSASHAQQPSQNELRLRGHVGYMAADSLQGRRGGSPDANKVARYIESQFRNMGVKAWKADGDYLWSFSPRYEGKYYNVIGLIEGSDPSLRHEYIIVGAHYDHLGVKNGKVYNGADDNASGTAAVIEIARSLVEKRAMLGRSVLVVAFDGEEQGLLGSHALADTLFEKGELSACRLMFSIDMVGWLDKGGPLAIANTASLRDADRIFKVTNEALQRPVHLVTRKYDNMALGSTDHEPFARHGVPAMYVCTGLKSPYHKPEDDADLINYEGLDRVTTFMSNAIITLSREPELIATGRQSLRFRERLPLVEAGVNVAAGSSHMAFPGTAFTGRNAFSCCGGLSLQLNGRRFSLVTGAEYNLTRAKMPLEVDPYNTSLLLTQQQLTVPLQLQCRIYNQGANAFYINLGAYGSGLLSHSYRDDGSIYNYPPADMQYGLQWGLGIRLTHIVIEDVLRYQIGNTFKDGGNPAAPNAHLNQAVFRIGYIF